MLQRGLFPEIDAGPRPAPAREPVAAPSGLLERMRWIDGRRVLVTAERLDRAGLAALARAARFGPLEVRFRIPTPDRRLAEFLEPGGPPPALRFAALRLARRAGLAAGVLASPLIPGVTADAHDLERLFVSARAAGALFLATEVVVPGEAREAWLRARLRRAYPRVAARHEVWRRTSSGSPDAERERVRELVAALAVRFGLPGEAGSGRPSGPRGQRSFAFAG